jgi:hypothetical protein
MELKVDGYNADTSKSGLVHLGYRWFNNVRKIISDFLRIIPTQVYVMCQVAVFIGVTATGMYCYPWALVGTL